MSDSEHRRAVRAALGVDAELKGLFARLGTAEHPNGRVLRAYRVARRALRDALRERGVFASGPQRAAAVAETLGELKGTLRLVAAESLQAAAAAGAKSARTQLEVLGARTRPTVYDTGPALAGWLATVESQAVAVQAAVATGADAALIVGDDEQPGMLNPTGPTRAGSQWLAQVAQGSWWEWVAASSVLTGYMGVPGSPDGVLKQAIAAIDERTTQCCLMVHGQVQEMDEDFELQGRPRFADRLQWAPFHWYCRSSVALVRRADVDDGLTWEMLRAALRELEARRDGGRVEIHPSHGRSGRSMGAN